MPRKRRRDVKLIETVLLAFIVAKIKRYDLKPIFKNWAIYPILICAATYVYLESTIWRGDYSLIKYSNIFKTIYLSSFIILAFKCKQYKALVYSTPLVLLGFLLNWIAIRANLNKMPVFISNSWATGYIKPDTLSNSTIYGDFHVLGTAQTKLIPICDVWDFGWGILSIGDLLVRAFAFIVLFVAIKSSINKINKKISN